jgi:hypothetical protein
MSDENKHILSLTALKKAYPTGTATGNALDHAVAALTANAVGPTGIEAAVLVAVGRVPYDDKASALEAAACEVEEKLDDPWAALVLRAVASNLPK